VGGCVDLYICLSGQQSEDAVPMHIYAISASDTCGPIFEEAIAMGIYEQPECDHINFGEGEKCQWTALSVFAHMVCMSVSPHVLTLRTSRGGAHIQHFNFLGQLNVELWAPG